MSRRASLALAFAAGILITTAFANKALPDLAPPPDGSDGNGVNLVVKRAPRASVSRIVIPRKLLAAAKRAEDGAAAPNAAAPREDGAAAPPTQSIIAGVAISLAIVAGFLAFRKKKPALGIAAAAGALLIGALGIWAASATANVPPPVDRPEPPKPVATKIMIEIVEEGDAVVLTLGRGL